MKYIKLALIIFIVAIILWDIGIQVPFIANQARSQIKKSMSIAEVTGILTSYAKPPDICSWEKENADKPIFSTRKQCDFPKEAFLLEKGGKNIKLSITFMGPGFLHNDFQVIFDSSGYVLAVSEVKHWD